MRSIFRTEKGKSWALPLAAAVLLASCNNANGPMNGALERTVERKVEKPVQSRPKVPKTEIARALEQQKRAIALDNLAARLEAQKTALSNPQPDLQPKVELAAAEPALAQTKLPSVADALVPAVENDEQPAVVAALPRLEKVEPSNGPLGRFHKKLTDLKNGKRNKPIVVLHIGDSHVASDSFTRGIRTRLQQQYGDAGRGMVIPAQAFKYGVADQVSLTASGNWRSQVALKARNGGRFGLSGVNVRSRSSRASMTLTSKNGQFDWAEVTVATGPSQGSFKLKVGDKVESFEARAATMGSRAFRINAPGSSVSVIPGGGAQTTVLNWSTGKNVAGIQYVNFGLNGATVDITNRFDMKLVDNDVRRLDPDLIVYGYGTNEGFDDGLDTASYAKRAMAYVNRLKRNAPNADVVYLGAASGLRRKGNRACGSWSVPPKLGAVRAAVRRIAAQQGAAYWDWSEAMGGPCAINTWANKGLAAKDRVHLTPKGYQRSAASFADWLVTPTESNVRVALN